MHFAVAQNDLESAEWLLANDAEVDAKDYRGWTPLHETAHVHALEIAELLIENGAEINAAGKHGQTPLHVAAWNHALKIAELLIENGAMLNLLDVYFRNTPLDSAIDAKHAEMQEFLRSYGGKCYQNC